MADNEEKKSSFPLSEATIVTTIPILAYFYAYQYKYGYLKYYNISYKFVYVSVEDILISILALSVYIAIFVIWNYYFKSFFKERTPFSLLIWPLINTLPIFIIFLLLEQFLIFWASLITLIIMIAIQDLLPAWKRKGTDGYKKGLEIHLQSELVTFNKFDKDMIKLGFNKAVIIYLLLFTALLAPMCGEYTASRETKFTILTYHKQDYALITHFSDKFIFKRIDFQNQKFLNEFKLFSIPLEAELKIKELEDFKVITSK